MLLTVEVVTRGMVLEYLRVSEERREGGRVREGKESERTGFAKIKYMERSKEGLFCHGHPPLWKCLGTDVRMHEERGSKYAAFDSLL